MHDSLSRFTENFAAFLYGLEMNAFVVDWAEQPLLESWKRKMAMQTQKVADETFGEGDGTVVSDTTMFTTVGTPKRRGSVGGDGGRGAIRGGRVGMGGRGTGAQRSTSIPARSGVGAGRRRGGAGAGVGVGSRGGGSVGRGRGRGAVAGGGVR